MWWMYPFCGNYGPVCCLQTHFFPSNTSLGEEKNLSRRVFVLLLKVWCPSLLSTRQMWCSWVPPYHLIWGPFLFREVLQKNFEACECGLESHLSLLIFNLWLQNSKGLVCHFTAILNFECVSKCVATCKNHYFGKYVVDNLDSCMNNWSDFWLLVTLTL